MKNGARLGNYFELVYADIPSFGKAPVVAVEDIGGADVAVFGIPWDQTASLRPGARLGPRRIREQSLWFHEVWNPIETPLIPIGGSYGERVRQNMRIVDCGDVTVVPTDREATDRNIQETAAAIASQTFTLMLGGDHYVMYPTYAGFCDAHPGKTVGIVQIDAHNDLIDDDAVFGRNWSGTPMRRAITYSGVDPRALAQIGLRGFIGAAEVHFQQKNGVFVATADDVRTRGVDAVVEAACEQVLAHADLVYVTVDIDSVDPSFAPGTCTPVPAGLSSAEFMRILRKLGTVNEVAGLDLVEVAPPLDPTDQTTLLAAYALFQFLEERFLRGPIAAG
jgi:agmatinase